MTETTCDVGCREIATLPSSEMARGGFVKFRFERIDAGRFEICEVAFSSIGVVLSRIVLERIVLWRTL